MSKYLLSPNAVRSLEGIEEYTLDTFGKIQTGIYLKKLYEKMQFVAENPKELGRLREDIFSNWNCYSCFVGSHTIYYEIILNNEINIIDILHQSMEPQNHLVDEA